MNSMFVSDSEKLTSKDTDSGLQASQPQEICWPSIREPGWHRARMTWSWMTKPGWCTLDHHHLPYRNILHSPACRDLCYPLLQSLCSVPLSLLIKTSASTERRRWTLWCESPTEMSFETWVPHLPGGQYTKISHFPWHRHLPLSIGFQSGSQPDLRSVASSSFPCVDLPCHPKHSPKDS